MDRPTTMKMKEAWNDLHSLTDDDDDKMSLKCIQHHHTTFSQDCQPILHKLSDITDSAMLWHIEVRWDLSSISYLTHDVIIHFAKSNHMSLHNTKLLPKVRWQLLSKQSSSMKTEHVCVHHMYKITLASLELILYCAT